MKYIYKSPELLDYKSFLENFPVDFSTSESAAQVMNINVWAYGVCSSLPNPPEDDGWGGTPYNQPGCLPS